MNFSYRLTKKDYKKIIYDRNRRTNLIYITVLALMFLVGVVNLVLKKPLLVFIVFLIYIVFMYLVLFVLNIVITNIIVKINEKSLGMKYGTYKCSLKNNYFIEQLDDYKLECDFNNLRKIKYRKNSVEIYPNDKLIFIVFKRSLFTKEKDYDKLVTILKEKVSISK